MSNNLLTISTPDASGTTIGPQIEPGITAKIDGQEFHLGYSRIASYLACPKQYKFTYMDKVPYKGSSAMRKGQAYHGTVEALLQHKMDTGEKMLLKQADRMAVNIGKKEKLTPNEIYKLIDGVRYYHEHMYDLHDPVGIEDSFSIVRGGVTLTGRIDLYDRKGVIIDHKFSHDIWPEERAKHGVQPMIYQWAGLDVLTEKYGVPYSGFSYNVARTWPSCMIQVIHIPLIDQWTSDWWEEQVSLVAQAVRAGLFPANPGDKACKWCQHKKVCQPAIYKPWISIAGPHVDNTFD